MSAEAKQPGIQPAAPLLQNGEPASTLPAASSAVATTASPAPTNIAPSPASKLIPEQLPLGDRLRLTPRGLAMTVGLLLAGGGVFYHWFYVQNFQSWNNADWQHAYFVPLVVLYLLWVDRKALLSLQPRVFWPGVLPVLLGLACFLYFQLGAQPIHMPQGWGIVLTVFGLVLWLLGPAVASRMLLPVGYLLFGITVSESVMTNITFQLQLLASVGSAATLNIIGISTVAEGNVLKVDTANGVVPLNVAEACSGMRQVIAFLALGTAVSLVATHMWWKRVVLLMLAVPVALLMNVGRVAVLGILSAKWDPKLASGEAHMFIGTLLLVPAFFLYLGIVWALNTAVAEDDQDPAPAKGKKAAKAAKPLPSVWADRAYVNPKPVMAAFLVAVGLLSATAVARFVVVKTGGVVLTKEAINAPGGRVVAAIARETPNWKQIGEDHVESKEVIEELGTTNYLTRQYVQKNPESGRPAKIIGLHLAYYTGTIEAVPHVPERCFVGGGWMVRGRDADHRLVINPSQLGWEQDPTVPDRLRGQIWRATVPAESGSAPLSVRMPRGLDELRLNVTEFEDAFAKTRMVAGYFFIANGHVTHTALGVQQFAFDRKNRYAFYLKVQVQSVQVESADELASLASDLLGELLPDIMRSVPDWVEVEEGRYPAGVVPAPNLDGRPTQKSDGGRS